MNISHNAERALAIMENTNESLFLTGKAGTGKSTLLKQFRETTTKNVVVLAPTGVAALNVNGQTIHSFFKLYPGLTPDQIRRRRPNKALKELLEQIETIIIDEISMVRCDLLDTIDLILRHYLRESIPFGNKQIIFIGDLYQLPPVVRKDEQIALAEQGYQTPYFFSSRALEDFHYQTIELNEVYRQNDEEFINILNRIRSNEIDIEDLNTINRQHHAILKNTNGIPVTLTTTNATANQINEYHLSQIPTNYKVCNGVLKGEFQNQNLPTELNLKFKIGAQIILLNNDPAGRWVNGSIGHITGIKLDETTNEPVIKVKLTNNEEITVGTHTWEVSKYQLDPETNAISQEAVGSFKQYPFKLAWAITIHKSQGQTFDHAIIDLGSRTFAHGQAYVALSRCTSLEGISLKTPIKPEHITLDPSVIEFMESIY